MQQLLFKILLAAVRFVFSFYLFCFIPLSDASAGNDILTKATVPIYATGVLTCYNQVNESRATAEQ